MRALELKIPPVALALITGAAMWGLAKAAPSLVSAVPFRQGIAAFLAVAGVSVAVLGVLSFRRSRTTVNPTTPQRTSALVTTGIYRVSRNPMYLGFLLLLVAWAAFLANVLALLPVVAFIAFVNRFQIAPEEQALAAMFGDDYFNYKRRVRRWV